MEHVREDPTLAHGVAPGPRVAVVTETHPPQVHGLAMRMARAVDPLKERRHRVRLSQPRQHGVGRPAYKPGLGGRHEPAPGPSA